MTILALIGLYTISVKVEEFGEHRAYKKIGAALYRKQNGIATEADEKLIQAVINKAIK